MTTKATVTQDPSTDVGDKISVSIGHKKNLGNYQTMDWHVSVTLTQRPEETTDEVFARGWKLVEDELDERVSIVDAHLKS
jgi:hypothetical protein